MLIRCVRCRAYVLCERSSDHGNFFEFDHVCPVVPKFPNFHTTYAEYIRAREAWDRAAAEKEKLPPLRPKPNPLMCPKNPNRLISPIKNQTINRIKAPGGAVSSSEKHAQTRANSGVAKNPSKPKRRFLAKKNQTNNQTSH